ncbi:unnamed protein product, partial [Discosporangium mesarthrocarpum]
QGVSYDIPAPTATRTAARQLGDFLSAPPGTSEERLGRTRAQTRALIDEVSPTIFIARAIDAGYDPGSYKLPERSLPELGFEPQTYSQFVTSEYSDVWFEAMDGLLRADAFSLAELPPGRKAVGAKWVFKWKTDEMGIVTRAKARLVAKGFSQKPGIDYFETFAPTPASSTVRLLAAIANECDLEMIHLDAEQAFIQADIDAEVY